MSTAEDLAMIRTRRTLEALLMTRAARRPSSPYRDPSAIEIVLGLAAFLSVAAFGLYLAAALGR